MQYIRRNIPAPGCKKQHPPLKLNWVASLIVSEKQHPRSPPIKQIKMKPYPTATRSGSRVFRFRDEQPIRMRSEEAANMFLGPKRAFSELTLSII